MIMEDIKKLKELMEEKTKQKIQFLKELKSLNSQIKIKREEISKKIPKGKENTNPDLISKKIEKLEFYISTAAYTPAQEREIIRKIEELKKQLKSSLENQKEWDEIKKLKNEIKEMDKKKKALKTELTAIISELDELYKKIINFATKRKKEKQKWAKQKKEREEEETSNYSKAIDSDNQTDHYITLEDILKINQKQQKP